MSDTMHHSHENSCLVARKLLEECGLERWELLQIPRLAPLSDRELDRIQGGRQYASRLTDERRGRPLP